MSYFWKIYIFCLLFRLSFITSCLVLFPTISIAETDPCEQLNCTEYEWCGEKDGVYGCFCDEHHHRPNNESYGEVNLDHHSDRRHCYILDCYIIVIRYCLTLTNCLFKHALKDLFVGHSKFIH